MSARLNTSQTNVVELAVFRPTPRQSNSVVIYNSARGAQNVCNGSAELLSMRQQLAYQASVEIDDIVLERAGLNNNERKRITDEVRALLDREFGKLRVHRYRGVFVVRHRSVEALISSLLRVQFHAHHIHLPNTAKTAAQTTEQDQQSIALTWGVGKTNSEAEVERLRRRRQKYRR